MHPTITHMLIQARWHELEGEAARIRLAATAKPTGVQRRRTAPVAVVTAVLLLATGTLLAACGGSSTTATYSAVLADRSQDAAQLFQGACTSCHGPLGEGGPSGVRLNDITGVDRQRVIDAIRHGVGGMPPSNGGMSDEQIRTLAEYVVGLR